MSTNKAIKFDERKSEFIVSQMRQYREKLLDLTLRNKMLNYKHSNVSAKQVRVVDEIPDFLFSKLVEGRPLELQALPMPEDLPPEEKKPDFQRAMVAAKQTDEEYNKAMAAIDPDDDEAFDKGRALEWKLRQKVRGLRGLKPLADDPNKVSEQELAERSGIDLSFELPIKGNAAKHEDEKIQTPYRQNQLNARANGLYSQITLDEQESGANTLYFAFGFLEWKPEQQQQKGMQAPLVLLPVSIKRTTTPQGYRFQLMGGEEDVQVNLSLQALLKRDFGLELPEWQSEDTPSTYITRVERDILKRRPQWRVRNFATLGRFSFAKLIMYNDLEEKKWSNEESLQRIESVLKPQSDGNPLATHEYPVDDPKFATQLPVLIYDADASQHSALIDAMQGQDMVIKGPPGTGKSQTITNLIANAIAKGKTILFLAEKNAALNVVYQRLSQRGLAPFCLELHSNKIKKPEVYKSLRERIELKYGASNTATIAQSIKDFLDSSSKLENLRDALKEPYSKLAWPLKDILWHLIRRQDEASPHIKNDLWNMPKEHKTWAVKELSNTQYENLSNDLSQLELASNAIFDELGGKKHIWSWVGAASATPLLSAEIMDTLQQLDKAIAKLEGKLKSWEAETGYKLPTSIEGLSDWLDSYQAIADTLTSDKEALGILAKIDGESLEEWRELFKWLTAYNQSVANLSLLCTSPVNNDEVAKWKGLISSGEKHGLQSSTLGELNAVQQRVRQHGTYWNKYQSRLEGLMKQVGLNPRSVTQQELKNLLALLTWGLEQPHVPASWLAHAQLAGNALARGFDSLSGEFEKLSDLRKPLSESLYEEVCTLELAQVAMWHKSLTNAAWYSWLAGGDCWKAWWQMRKLTPTSNLARAWAEKLALLKAMYGCRKQVEVIRNLEDVPILAGPAWKKEKTDFPLLSYYVNWHQKGRSLKKAFAKLSWDDVSLKALEWREDWLDELPSLTEWAGVLTELPGNDEVSCQETTKRLQEHSDIAGKIEGALKLLSKDGDSEANLEAVQTEYPHFIKANALREAIEDVSDLLKKKLDSIYRGTDTDADEWEKAISFVHDLQSLEGGTNLANWITGKGFSKNSRFFLEQKELLQESLVTLRKVLEYLTEQSVPNWQKAFGLDSYEGVELVELSSWSKALLGNMDSLTQWLDYLRKYDNIADTPLAAFVEDWEQKHKPMDLRGASITYDYYLMRAIIEQAYRDKPLKDMNLQSFSKLCGELKDNHNRWKEAGQKVVYSYLCGKQMLHGSTKGSKHEWTEGAFIRKETGKQRALRPVRELIKQAGLSVQSIKPCFLMSPLSVAQFIPLGTLKFDIIVIDEASQMPPEEAMGAILRGSQLIVVGDEKQLPPTSFFNASGQNATLVSDEDDNDAVDGESILDLAIKTAPNIRRLERHYRSKHEDLIRFSNYHFYDNKLVVYPVAKSEHPHLGIRNIPIAGKYAGSTNPSEVSKVVELALEHMRTRPDDSLGIATMNMQQRQLIESELELVIPTLEYARTYTDLWRDKADKEPLFIKNLENVQGDERDVIIISTVYGPDESGNVRQNFGPINKNGGERRLNVLFSRARKQVQLVTSLKASDITGTGAGVKAFRDYLDFAATGRMDGGTVDHHRPPDSDFEVSVQKALERQGYKVDAQVGVNGFFIDMAIKHPDYPHGYLLGVECDGATFHSSPSARERDLIRENILQDLGWTIHRIWSTDWFTDPKKEIERLQGVLKERLAKMKTDTVIQKSSKVVQYQREELILSAPDSTPLEALLTQPRKKGKVVAVNDGVFYRFIDDDKKEHAGTIVRGASDANLGLIGSHTPLGMALLGLGIDEVNEVIFPNGVKEIQIIKIEKPD